ncbi:hypothetical protein PROFUN_09733 [Planoprotostelium fungivorum]|uniref:DUF7869 domain-containing protein n=1 Tax=Planoprotostelium fungivorum TaxID=1890364 RepID=A0A2P6NEV2_9EUKA|nr:hypothetical protein PROFUN_09733 [Planoprotostelium fungivorum]
MHNNQCEAQHHIKRGYCCAQHLTSLTNWKTRRKVSKNSATKKHIQCMFIEKEHLGFLWFEIILYKQRLIELFGSYVVTIHHIQNTSLCTLIQYAPVEVPTHSRNIAPMPGNSPKEALCLTWIHKYLEKTCDQVPNDNKLYLPVGITVNLIWQDYHAYCMSNNSILPSLPPYGQEHFRQLLQTHFPNVTKVRNCRLGKCDTCSQWKESRAQLSGSALEEARVLYCNHLKMQSCLRMLYLERSLESQSNPNKSWTIILDCAQSQPIVHRVSACKTLLALKEHLPECGIAGLINHAFGTRELHFLDQNIPHDSSMIISLLWERSLESQSNPNKSWTIILDCAQSQPIVHRVSACKTLLALKEHLPECGIAGLINHAFGTRELHFLDQNIPHDSSMIISLLWGHLLRTFKQHPNCFPDLLNVQLDNCWKDNKNQYMFAFLSLLVHLRMFKTVRMHFLMKGHTHCDVDHFFSIYAKPLPTLQWDTISELIAHIKEQFKTWTPLISRSPAIYNWKQWMTPHLSSISGHSSITYATFSRNQDGDVVMHYSDDINPASQAVGVLGRSAGIKMWNTFPTGTTLLPATKVAEDWDADQLRALQSAEQFIKDVDEHRKWYQTPTVSDDIANFWEWSTCFPDQHEDVPYQVGRPPGELSSRPLWSVYTSEMEQNNRSMYIAYEDIDNQWTLGKIIKFCNRNGYKVQQMIFADPQWRLLNCYEIVFPQRVIHQDVKFKRNQTVKKSSMDEISLAHSNFTKK